MNQPLSPSETKSKNHISISATANPYFEGFDDLEDDSIIFQSPLSDLPRRSPPSPPPPIPNLITAHLLPNLIPISSLNPTPLHRLSIGMKMSLKTLEWLLREVRESECVKEGDRWITVKYYWVAIRYNRIPRVSLPPPLYRHVRICSACRFIILSSLSLSYYFHCFPSLSRSTKRGGRCSNNGGFRRPPCWYPAAEC
ncbi:hypothetical protein QVD17_28456 [Tagetes erecta]|uniref:Uncharacterized protein n=1 Tax=Tagetes erecta TaxID=13708 RepID=A0AAD8KDV1_TARER|nr:hypothetical protein QVD17_28456 [Tagetes erecta]